MGIYGGLLSSGGGSGGGGTVVVTEAPIEKIRVNGTELQPVNKTVDIEVPTKSSDLTDDTHVELTQAGYEALSDDEKNNGKVYLCTDTGVTYRNGVVYGASTEAEVPIKSIKVNGVEIAPVNSSVNIEIPDIEVPIKSIKINGVEVTPVDGSVNIEVEDTEVPIEVIKVNGTEVAPVNKEVNIEIPDTEVPIKSIKVNGVELIPVDDAVEISIPDVEVSIESIKVNGVEVTPVDKVVDIAVPTKVTDLEIDSVIELTEEEYINLPYTEWNKNSFYFCYDTHKIFYDDIAYGGFVTLSYDDYLALGDRTVSVIYSCPDINCIFIDDVRYSASISITEEMYNMMPDDEKNSGAVYFIEDKKAIYHSGVKYGGSSNSSWYYGMNFGDMTAEEVSVALADSAIILPDLLYRNDVSTTQLRTLMNTNMYSANKSSTAVYDFGDHKRVDYHFQVSNRDCVPQDANSNILFLIALPRGTQLIDTARTILGAPDNGFAFLNGIDENNFNTAYGKGGYFFCIHADANIGTTDVTSQVKQSLRNKLAFTGLSVKPFSSDRVADFELLASVVLEDRNYAAIVFSGDRTKEQQATFKGSFYIR